MGPGLSPLAPFGHSRRRDDVGGDRNGSHALGAFACTNKGPVLRLCASRSRGTGMMLSLKLRLVAGALLLAASLANAYAQDYPSRAITLVVPYAAGGGNDAMARIVADHMGKTLGHQIVVENRGGAGGTIATRAVAKAAPDGYTLVIGGTGTLAINPTLYANVGYDPRKDFAAVGLIATSALVILVHPRVDAKSAAELIALARREPGK